MAEARDGTCGEQRLAEMGVAQWNLPGQSASSKRQIPDTGMNDLQYKRRQSCPGHRCFEKFISRFLLFYFSSCLFVSLMKTANFLLSVKCVYTLCYKLEMAYWLLNFLSYPNLDLMFVTIDELFDVSLFFITSYKRLTYLFIYFLFIHLWCRRVNYTSGF